MSVFCIEAGFGCMFSHSTNFYTYVPDSIDEFFGQRRRWIEGWIVGPTHFYFCNSSFFTMRFWRFPYWLATCWTQFYVVGLMPAIMVSSTALLMGTKWPITNECRPNMLAAVGSGNLPCPCSGHYTDWIAAMAAKNITGADLRVCQAPLNSLFLTRTPYPLHRCRLGVRQASRMPCHELASLRQRLQQ